MTTDGGERPIISICIPTFNRSEKLFKLINNILNYQGDKIEVVVLDNCSTDHTASLVSTIKDNRLTFFENEKNIGGFTNLLKVLTLAKGQYAFICLDKDNIDYKKIDELIARLDDDIVFGHCSLDLAEEGLDTIFEQGFSSVMGMAYLSQHPTGTFYKTDIYKNAPILQKIFTENKKFGFYIDLVNAEMALMGKSKIINLPVFSTEQKHESKNTPSFSYTEKDVFFSPNNRMLEFDIYAESAQNLKLPHNDFVKLMAVLYDRELQLATFGYKNAISDYAICSHYGMSTRKVGMFELWKLNYNFSSNFLKKEILIGNLPKLYMVLKGHTKTLIKSLITK